MSEQGCKQERINRLIILGNGFDLAHGLKTSYNDFIDWIFLEKIEQHNQNLFEVNYTEFDLSVGLNNSPLDNVSSLKNFLIRNDKKIITAKHNMFFYSLVKKTHLENWVDIENEYFKHLLAILKEELNPLSNNKNEIINKLEALHNEFEEIKNLLEIYLSNIDFESKLNYSFYFDKAYNHDKVEKVLILNFNYTKFIEQYLLTFSEHLLKVRLKIINIHGELKNSKNPIIFGYGDEKHPNYNGILNSPKLNNNYLSNVKHYKYLQTKNYDKLIAFLDSNSFDVQIFGHSCGNSDRTLLNEIFEHNNLINKGVHIFLRGDKDEMGQRQCYNDITIQLSRVLNKSSDVRKKVKNFEDSEKMFCVK